MLLLLFLLHHQQVHVNTKEVGTLSEAKPIVNLVLEPCQISFLSVMAVTGKYVCAAAVTIQAVKGAEELWFMDTVVSGRLNVIKGLKRTNQIVRTGES